MGIRGLLFPKPDEYKQDRDGKRLPIGRERGEMMRRVPHCSDCGRCKGINVAGYTEYYCCKDAGANEYGETVGSLGVDHPPKTSPKWCPLREGK